MVTYEDLDNIEKRLSLDKKGLELLVMIDKLRAFAQILDSLIILKGISLDEAEKNIDGWEDIHEYFLDFEEEFVKFCIEPEEEFTKQSYCTFKFEEAKSMFEGVVDYLFTDLIPAINEM